ncbi:hypothetical protein BJY16_004545 [Actinoplanes octamycinicus]|uniref:WD40 repeat protein n=1 Tax=Actinoplanes octamycinicus TaxID=135948 RepID=A0A7W7GZC2_9ACTN|nr:hypothetical protein [Actinoplanes octamycinicus]MBB4741086.1 hypothetical protein [Actinoplanes octamycinicus]GIE55991.1 TolB-like translocation protein; signal peptide [Actinoplanes octamycinicus]
MPERMSLTGRILLLGLVVVVVLGGALGYVMNHANRPGLAATSAVDASPGDRVLFRNTAASGYGHVASVARGGEAGVRQVSDLACDRLYAAAGRGVCLRPDGSLATYQLAVLDSSVRVRDTYPVVGVPNRARVSPSGNVVAWTVFVTGDSYNGGRFSTRAGMINLATGETVDSLELLSITREGQPYHAVDVNFWGVTFADDQHFYATMSTAGRRYLVAGDVAARSVRTLAANVECPSLSPDRTRIAFKEAIGGDPAKGWRLTVLDLASMRRTALAETRSVDDQAAWYDAGTVMYGIRRGTRQSDVWAVPADGGGAPRLLIPDAESPAALWN